MRSRKSSSSTALRAPPSARSCSSVSVRTSGTKRLRPPWRRSRSWRKPPAWWPSSVPRCRRSPKPRSTSCARPLAPAGNPHAPDRAGLRRRQKMKTIRWGVIGCGDVAEVKSGPGFYKAGNSQLVAVMRRNGALAADFARRHNVPRWHVDADAIIRANDIDAVYIATHTDSHHEYTLRCAAAGKPVYVEKPMALHLRQCIEMVEACEANKVPLWVGY